MAIQALKKMCGHWVGVTCHCITLTHNGLCTCRGTLDPHPFHSGSITSGGMVSDPEYVGRHRKSDPVDSVRRGW